MDLFYPAALVRSRRGDKTVTFPRLWVHVFRNSSGCRREEGQMNVWRKLVPALLLIAALAVSFTVYGQEKGKDKEKDKDKGKGGEKVELTFKAFEGKEPFFQEINTVTSQNMTVMGMKHQQEQNQTFYFSWTPDPAKSKDGKFVVTQKILGIKMNIDIGGNKIAFNSLDKEQPKNPMSEFFKALIGTEFTLTIGKDSKGKLTVEKVEGVTALVNKLKVVNPQMEGLLNKILKEESIKQMAQPMLSVVPGRPVAPNDSWDSAEKLSMGPIGTYVTTNKYTYEGPAKEKGMAQIKVKTSLKYETPAETEKGLPFKILPGSTLKSSDDSGGTVLFNTVAGRVESADMNVKLEGTLKIEIANMDTTVELNQTQVTKLKTMDKNPIAK
jgi:Family of unknown function (DUF6263)